MSNSIFQSVVTENIKYNNFNLSREVLVSGQIGKLIPVQCDEVVPGDMFKESAAFLMRFAPLSAPAMARFNVHFHTFYIPYRIITPETSRESTYEKFIKSIGKHSEDVPVLPFIFGQTNTIWKVGSLSDYLGFPIGSYNLDATSGISAMPYLAYQRVYQDFYRRDQIEPELVYPSDLRAVNIAYDSWVTGTFDTLEEGQLKAQVSDLFKLQTKNYERDYFTSALLEPQFGDEVVVGNGTVDWIPDSNYILDDAFPLIPNATTGQPSGSYYRNDNIGQPSGYDYLGLMSIPAGGNDSSAGTNYAVSRLMFTPQAGQQLASALEGNRFTINEFRLAMQLQGIKEKINRVGTRYLEIMQGIYGVRVPDARLQRPVYLGGFKSPLTIGSVMQTSESGTTPQGTLTGQMSGTGTNRLTNGKYMFLEHGYLMTIMSVTPRTSYYGGMPKKYCKKYPEDFYLPDFDHLGEQEIKKSELFFSNSDVDNETFGYTPRYSEYKSSFSTVHGEFRTTLDNWHVSRDFDTSPVLNTDFIKAEPEDFDRIFQFQNIENTSNEHFYCQIYLDVVSKRNMSKYSTPYTLY